ncbi:hypothetical protein ACFYYI_17920 [Streptomyces sp. NPDC002387]|uniref:hypothetical protein n=1 Tax=Streptomyces sp. NPDC002387 TaxID=3364643 RepID=UPI0036A9494D
MDIYYVVGPEDRDGAETFPAHMLRRQEALSLMREGVRERIALQEALSLIRLGVASHLRIPHESHLENAVTRAVACAEAMAVGGSVTVGRQLITADPEPGNLQDLACEAARERHRLLPPTAGTLGGGAYISRGWPSGEECARLAHKLIYEMGYSQAHVARIFETVDDYERPAVWTRQGLNRLLWEEDGGERYPRYHYRQESGDETRLEGRTHLLGANVSAMAVLGDEGAEAAATTFDDSLDTPHHFVLPVDPQHPERGLASLAALIMDLDCVRTLYVTSPDTVFASPAQRRVMYDLALFRGVQVMENGTRIDAVDDNPLYNRLLREGTELFAVLRVRDNATIVEEARSLARAQQIAAGLHGKGLSLRKIATRLDEEAIPTPSRQGTWSASAVQKLLDPEREANR